MRTPVFDLQDVLDAFRRRKVLTKRELLEQTGCSSMTAWRLLRQHGYHTSYNGNARHYTLVGVPQFDEHGLWADHDVRFSRWGSLIETIVALVEHSSAGLTARQLQELLHIENLKPILTRLMQRKSLTRERINASFVYFAPHRTARSWQHQQRQAQLQQAATHCALPALNDIVGLLVEIIRRPDKAPRQWARRLAQKGIRLGTRDIQAVLTHYGIDVKKGLSKS
ncbi:MAG TPA: hypothetical protein VFC37_13545 [Terracidiphilus sp.]|nr:hypothetical protein [Terracidiphilus sp.]